MRRQETRSSTGQALRTLRWSAALLTTMGLVAACGSDDTSPEAEPEASQAASDDDAGSDDAGSDDAGSDDAGSDDAESDSGDQAAGKPIVLGDLAYFTGDFGTVGAYLAAQVDFPVNEVINLDPPLGRPIEVIHEDIGTVGEAQAARKLLEQDGSDILLSSAHEYFTYRDFALDWLAENDGPLMPTVHGGVIPTNVGGVAEEPIFRAQGSDEGMAVTNALYAESIGAKTAVIMTTPTAGYQLTADAAEKALEILDIDVLERIDAPAEQASYRTEIQKAVDSEPDVIIIFAQVTESAVMVKQAAEAGLSGKLLGEAGWVEPEFVDTATTEAIANHEIVAYPGFGLQENAAWEFYQPLWDDNPEYNQHTTADDFYSYTTYDLLIVTALAIEAGGSTNASDWAPAMFEVTEAPGTQCFTYADCLGLIRSGEDVDYEGVTGPATYSAGGINAVIPTMFVFGPDGSIADEIVIDSERHLELLDQVSAKYEE